MKDLLGAKHFKASRAFRFSAIYKQFSAMAAEASFTALEFLNYSSRHLYLTGKAGTGKTTFLRNLSEHCSKSFIVVAPTGVAALNAGGVTIHSQFLFPLGAYIADGAAAQFPDFKFFDRASLSRRHPLNAARKKVLQGIDLLVIDEISMVRADLLDAIDQRLRHARRKQKPFGGLQLLMIGDLYQLPPIMPEREWQVLKQHYASPHFFHSKALQQAGFIQVELQKVYRQQDDNFIEILNRIRHNALRDQDLERLNQRATEKAPKDAIHLVTHRQQAQEINAQRLAELDSKLFKYKAQLKGDFPERSFPVEEDLELKIGAQVMFIKNDTEEGAYYNGKIAEVVDLDREDIWVQMEDHEHYKVPKDTWKNSRYKLNDEKQELEEEVLGEFSHFPIRLAWAITIHKSQGLSFDEAVIDLGRAFAPGQAYVALTRLRSMEGLYLQAPLRREAMIIDAQAREFSAEKSEQDLEKELHSAKSSFQHEYLIELFDWNSWQFSYTDFWQKNYDKLQLKKYGFKPRFERIEKGIQENLKHARKFQAQIDQLIRAGQQDQLETRLLKAREYFLPRLEALLIDLQALKLEYARISRTKLLVQALELPVTEGFGIFLNLSILPETFQFFYGGTKPPAEIAQEQKPKIWEALINKVPEPQLKLKPKAKKGDTYRHTYKMIKEGLSLQEIAEERELTLSTIYRHCVKGVQQGELNIEEVLEDERRLAMQAILKEETADNAYKMSLKHPDYSQDEWRVIMTKAPENTETQEG